MTLSSYAGGDAAAVANAIKASGAIVHVTAEDFLQLLYKADSPLVIHSELKIFKVSHQYLASVRGFFFAQKPMNRWFFRIIRN